MNRTVKMALVIFVLLIPAILLAQDKNRLKMEKMVGKLYFEIYTLMKENPNKLGRSPMCQTSITPDLSEPCKLAVSNGNGDWSFCEIDKIDENSIRAGLAAPVCGGNDDATFAYFDCKKRSNGKFEMCCIDEKKNGKKSRNFSGSLYFGKLPKEGHALIKENLVDMVRICRKLK